MLTKREQETLQFLKRYIAEHQYSPTITEIAEELGVKSRAMIQRILSTLEKGAYIKRVSGLKRNIQLLESAANDALDALPLVGRIAAGLPIEAIEHQEHILMGQLLGGSDRFLLEVKGDSMSGDNICDGDWIICESCQVAPAGKIVIALVDGEEATLKRIEYRSDGHVVLLPSNPKFLPQIYSADRVQIQGVYVGLVRLVN